MAREALGIVGAAVGFAIGGPTGAQIGFGVGYSVGGYIDPVKVPHPGLSDAPIQTSRDGVPIPIIHGLHYCHGNILQKNPEEIVTTYERQGKGGGSTEVETKSRFRTFAIGICRAPIAEVTRIWENNKLVYDARSSPAIPAAETAKYLEGITIYTGDEGQLPDPELEAHWGADNTPAYRGLAYIVWNNKDLTDTGGAIPQFAFEVNGSRDLTVTSKPYPIEAVDGITATPAPIESVTIQQPLDGVDASITPQTWEVLSLVDEYSYETEGVDVAITPQTWAVASLVNEYDFEVEGIDVAITPQSWLIETIVVSHEYETEGVDATVTPLTWTVTTA